MPLNLRAALLLMAVLLAGCSHKEAASAGATGEQKPAEEEAGPKVARDTNGNAVITMGDEAQGDMGILVKKLEAAQISPEVKGYGRVLDPSPLVALINELAAARAAYTASSNELVRLKTLAGQGNASARALQAAEAAALRDQLAIQSAKDRLALSWDKVPVDQPDSPALMKSLISVETALLRVDLPAGETLPSQSAGARIITLSGKSVEAGFLGFASSVDPQMQGQGLIFLVKSNAAGLAPGQSVTGYIKIPGEPLAGVIIPREAVVRTEGAGWVYVFESGGEAFTRLQVPLDHPTEAGWFVPKSALPGEYVVVTGAQQLLSLELKGQGGGE